jgi:hypothetical protein
MLITSLSKRPVESIRMLLAFSLFGLLLFANSSLVNKSFASPQTNDSLISGGSSGSSSDFSDSLISGVSSGSSDFSQGTFFTSQGFGGTSSTENVVIDSTIRTIITRVVVDGEDLNPNLGSQTTTGRSVEFHLAHSTSTSQFANFQCRLLGEANLDTFRVCDNVVNYFGLSLGVKTFQARAVDSDGDIGPVTSFTWTIASSTTESTELQQPSVDSSETLNEIRQNKEEERGQLDTIESALEGASAADDLANRINPPFLRCEEADTNVAIYNVEGEADIGRLLGSNGGIVPSDGKAHNSEVPVAVLLFNDINPNDYKNIILNNNQPFVKGKIVVFPGDPENQETVNFDIKKITTDCKKGFLRSEITELGSEGHVNTPDGGLAGAIVAPKDQANPPFYPCTVASGNEVEPVESAVVETSEEETALQPTESAAADTAEKFNLTESQEQQLIESNALAASASTGADLQQAQQELEEKTGAGQDTGEKSDVAKYVVVGTIKTNDLDFGDRQHVVLRIFNVLNPQEVPQFQMDSTKNSNNLYITAKIEVDPGDTDSWQVFFLDLSEVSTECLNIPFVSSPRLIGVSGADFFSGPSP